MTSLCVPQECGLHCGGNADPEATVGRVRGHGGHLQDRHAAHQAHAARGRVRLLQGLPAAGVCGGEVAADGGRPSEPPLRAGQLLKSQKSPPTPPKPPPSLPCPPAPPPWSPAFTASTAAAIIVQGSASLQPPAMPSITSVCLAKRDARWSVFEQPEGKPGLLSSNKSRKRDPTVRPRRSWGQTLLYCRGNGVWS